MLIVRRCLQELDSGDELTVVGDYPPAERSIRRTCYKHGYKISDVPQCDTETRFSLRICVPDSAPDSASPTDESVIS
ncbi:sulfurtransferase TusA family protein [Haladaptatus halobius]|uniref:sulfurtransferase TusA family protein n=1 Tax=Haladaptatus halobius TaxID=2884875 RepID=UPI0021085ABD|nr:sulfurtransferase TusA family protein [Haladaptatus halobius]